MVLRELPFPRGRQHRAKMIQVSDSLRVKVPGRSSEAQALLVFRSDASADQVFKEADNTVNSVIAADGLSYVPGAVGTVVHGVNTSPQGLPAYTFDGVTSGCYLSAQYSGEDLEQPYTVFVACKLAVTGSATVAGSYPTNQVQVRGDSFTDWIARAGVTLTNPGTQQATAWTILEAVFSGASSVLGVDGVRVTGNAGALAFEALRVGANWVGTGLFRGDIGETRVYRVGLNEEDRNAVLSELTTKWITG